MARAATPGGVGASLLAIERAAFALAGHGRAGIATVATAGVSPEEAALPGAAALARARQSVVRHLAMAAELRDDSTRAHTDRVANSAAVLARAYGLDAALAAIIASAATLHDIGKIAIPDRILLNPGRLTAEEAEVMHSHTQIGAAILSASLVPELRLDEVIALSHHERWDGSGYPNGLAGQDIPLAGRIAAIADVFDALVHERPCKRAWSVDDALEEIAGQRGRQFDPQLVDVFLSLHPARLVELSGGSGASARRAAIAAALARSPLGR